MNALQTTFRLFKTPFLNFLLIYSSSFNRFIIKAPISLECDNWRRSSRIVLDYFATKTNDMNTAFTLQSHWLDIYATHFSNFGLILKIYIATVARQSQDIPESVSQRSHECSLFSFSFVRQSRDIRESVARHS